MAAIKFVFGVLMAVAVGAVWASSDEERSTGHGRNCPWCPQWVKCNFTEVKGATCQDCNTKLVCTPVGGLKIKCYWPGKQHCVDGDCVAEPSDECSSATEEPEPEATATEQPEATATEQPEATATEQPEATATEQPEATATEQPEATATEQPEAIEPTPVSSNVED